jgi:putative copper export protein
MQMLLLKIAFFLLMIGLGAWNLFVLKLRLSRAAIGENKAVASTARPIESLVRSVACETLLAGAVLLVIGFLGVTTPPTH